MKKINELLNFDRSAEIVIADLKSQKKSIPTWETLVKEYEPNLHAICRDHSNRKDKRKSDGTVEKAARIHLGLEKLIVARMAEFMFALPVKRLFSGTEAEQLSDIQTAVEQVYKTNRINAQNLMRATSVFASCECATIWYAAESPNKLYGFDSKYKIKCKTLSPMDGYKLFPLFDELGDMIAFSFGYSQDIAGQSVEFFETYTANRHILWTDEDGWRMIKDEPNALGKIPVSYIYRAAPLFDGLCHLREEIEYTLSRNSDVIAYNSAPIIKVSGLVGGDELKGESRRIWRVENGGDVNYVSWAQSDTAISYQITQLLKFYFMQSQLPDVSFDNMKSLGSIGFDARKTLLTDAHLKVGDESGAFIEFLERECSIICAFLQKINAAFDLSEVSIEHIITPYVQNDEAAEINKWVNACGGKAVASQQEAIRQLGIFDDPQKVYEEIEAEAAAAAEAEANAFV